MDGEGADTTEPERSGGTPADQLAHLLARAGNGLAAARELGAVRSALMHHCGLQSCRHTKGPPRRMNRRTFRHSFLLPDGGVRLVWELEHDTDPDGRVRRQVFTRQEEVALAEWEVDLAFGGPHGPREVSCDPRAGAGRDPEQEDLDALLAAAAPENALRRTYTEGDSAEHARRLLRRAANAGAPGDEVRARLQGAIAHDISIVTRRSTLVHGRQVSWSLYEHAFLLLDGSELSLWEIDHTRTPSGDPVCEVYTSQDAALDTAVRRIEAG
ncbi:DUF6227 family protein [Actinacidiphila epipremni]|uniref:Uncharacterized protein n=1 Tax=Actinacidiphila epipremni TaxID=2053013 RepID=A0ABX0ZQ36_9ACTN|nr:DUF6227 family protein [Actinacidiphila epipremni]NJP43768.1 hypothetical protein [Actinacidiphila epipremni]